MPTTIDAPPTADLEAERAVIGSVLLVPEMLDDLAAMLSPADFDHPAHGTLYRHMLDVHNAGKKADAKLLLESLRRSGDRPPDGANPWASILGQCAQSVFTAANAKHYARLVRDRAVRRAIFHAGEQILNCSDIDDGDEAVNRVEEIAFAIRDKHRCGLERITSADDLLQSAMQELERREAGQFRPSWETGYPAIDNIMSLRPGELVILAARPSMGKTALGLNIATNVARQHQVLFVSLEMSNEQLADRILAAEAEVSTYALQRALSPNDRTRVIEAAANLSAMRLTVDDSPTRSVTEIAAVARRQKRKKGLAVLVVDYLQLVAPEDARLPRQEQVASMSRRLKAIAREMNICVLCLAQLNRQNEQTGNRRPNLSNLRESGAIEQDADIVMFIHREDYYLMPDEAEKAGVKGIAEVIVRKQRQGPVGTAKLLWQPQWTRFVSLADRDSKDLPNYDQSLGGFSDGFGD